MQRPLAVANCSTAECSPSILYRFFLSAERADQQIIIVRSRKPVPSFDFVIVRQYEM
jgi:hypothetical protein